MLDRTVLRPARSLRSQLDDPFNSRRSDPNTITSSSHVFTLSHPLFESSHVSPRYPSIGADGPGTGASPGPRRAGPAPDRGGAARGDAVRRKQPYGAVGDDGECGGAVGSGLLASEVMGLGARESGG